MKGKKRKASLSFIIFTILIHVLFITPTELANGGQIIASFNPSPNEPPDRPINIYPEDGAVDIDIPVTLEVLVYDNTSMNKGINVYFYNASDNVLIDNVTVENGSIASVVWNGLQNGRSYSWYAVANDSEYENTSQTWTFITESSYTPSPSEDPGEDDPPTTSDIYYIVAGSIIEAVIGDTPAGETREIILEKSNGISIDSIYFTPAVDLTNVKITMEKLADIPENITTTSTETKLVYAYVDIELTADNESIGEDEIKSLIIIFKVNLTWITENNMDKETIASMRYHNNEWQNCTTTILVEDETYVYCMIETNDTSIFTIVGYKVIEPPGPGEEEEQPPPPILLISLMAIIATLMPVLILKSKRRRRQIYYMKRKLNNVHDIELKVDELLSRLDNKNNKEIKTEKTGTKSKKKKVTKNKKSS